MDDCEAKFEKDERKIPPRLPIFNPPPMHSPERSGMQTPPLQTPAAVPFGWEEEPGKPRPCTTLVSFSNKSTTKCLELPPRLFIDAKLSSPTTVLEGPYMSEDCFGSFSGERVQLGTMVLSQEVGNKKKSWLASWRGKKAFKVKHVFPSSSDKDNDHDGNIVGSHKKMKMRKIKHYASFTNIFHVKSRVWTKICEGWKQVVTWGSKKQVKKCGCGWP